MKASEVHKMLDAELVEEAGNLRRKLFETRSKAVTEKLENPRQLGVIRKDIARILTEQSARKAQASQTKA